MPEVTNPETIKMLNALAAKQNAPQQAAQPVVRGAPQPIIATPAQTPEEEARKAREAQLKEEAAARAAASEARAQAEFEGTGGKPTEAQQKTGTLLTRIKGGFADIQAVRARNPEAQEAGLGETISRSIFGEGLLTRKISGADRRIVTDAQRDVLDALLTLGTGAAYNAEQLEGQTLSYFPQYGDSAEEVQTKNLRLQRLIESAKINAGPKWAEVEAAIAPFMPKPPGAPVDAAAPTGTGLRVAEGEEYSTDTDIALARRLSEAWQSGAPIEQLNAISVEVTGSPLSQQALDTLATDPDRKLSFTPARSGKREGGAPVAAAAIGAGLLKGYTGNLAEEAVGLISPDAAAKLQAAGEYAQEQAPVTSFVSELVGGAVSPLARLPLGKSGTVAGEAMRGAAYGGLYGGGEAAPGASISDRVTGAAIGATTGGTGGALAGRLMRPRGGGGSTTGGVAGDVAAAEQAGIPVLTSDVSPPSTFIGRSVQQVGERIPLAGTSGVRASQQEARVKAVQDVLTEYTTLAPETLPENIVSDLVAKRGGELSRYSKLKGEVIERLSDKGQVPLPRTMTVIDEQIAELSRRGTPAADEAIAELQNIRQTLQGRDLYGLEAYRADELANVFKDEGKFSVAAREVGEKALRKIYDPVRQDMRQFISEVGEPRDVTKWTVANKRLQALAGETEKQALKTVLRKGDATPELVENMLFSGKRSDVAALYRGLTPEGRATARAAVINRIFRNIGGDIENVSPERFVNEVRKQGNSIGVFFGGEDAAKINGLVRALKLTGRASQAPVLTASGQQLYVPFAVTGFVDAFGTGGAATAGAMTLGLMARAYESKPMRNLLLAMSKAKAGSEAESRIAAKIKEKLASAVKTASGQTGANAAPEPQTIQLEARQ